jgi:hypothetical protein
MEDALRHSHILALSGLLVFTASCSWYRNLERSLVEGDEKGQKQSASVSRQQYDQLLVKYEELAKKYEELKENPNAGKPSLVQDLQKTQSENFATTNEAETVDVFASTVNTPVTNIANDIDSQLALYRKGIGLKVSSPGEATKIFQQLETQGVPTVKAKARLQTGEILFEKGQYDLALQVFEDIISHHSHSGVVLDALKLAVQCADKLGSQNKKEQYASMLNDVFETN